MASRAGIPLTMERLLARGRRTENGCLEWTGGLTANGYAIVASHGKNHYVHRASYELNIGPIPEGLTIDHLCRNRACFEPTHLEAVTNRVNILRGTSASAQHAVKTHCVHGHSLADAYIDRKRNKRDCRTCRLAWSEAYRAQKKERKEVDGE